MSISPTLRAAARSVYRNLWRASATTFAGAICPFLSTIVTRLYLDVAGDPPVLLGMVIFPDCHRLFLMPLHSIPTEN